MALALHTDGTRLDCVQPATFPESGRSDHWNFGKMNGCFRPGAAVLTGPKWAASAARCYTACSLYGASLTPAICETVTSHCARLAKGHLQF